MEVYIKYGSIALMIAFLILIGYRMICGAVPFVFHNDNKTALLYLLGEGFATLIFPLLFHQKELKQLYLKHKTNASDSLEQTLVQRRAFLLDISAAAKNFVARVPTPVERFSFSL